VSNALPLSNVAVSEQLSLVDSEPQRFAFYVWRNVNVLVWSGPADVAAVQRMAAFGDQQRRHHPEGSSTVHVIKPHVGMPDAETRQVLIETIKILSPAVAAVAVVIGGNGFWASATRSVITGATVMARASFEMHMHSSLEQVVTWLPAVHLKKTGVAIQPDELLRVLKTASESLDWNVSAGVT
jgi:hypothetical protein